MDTPQAICMVRDAEGIRPLMPDERGRVAGFFLFGEGFGDMICLLPTVQKTAEQLAKRLDVWTRRPEVFANHSLLNPIRSDDKALTAYLSENDRLLIVSPVEFEGLPNRNQTHIVEQPARGIVDLQTGEKEVRLHTTDADRQRAAELLRPLDNRSRVVVHPNRSWEIRTWPSDHWRQLTLGLLELGTQVVVVGSEVPNIGTTEQNIPKGVFDLGIDHPSLLDLTDQTSLHELRDVIARCDLVITVDSGVLHIANCTDTHVLAIFTDIDPRFRTRFRDNQPNANTTVMHAPCEKQFCQSWHGGTGECIQPEPKRMCCLPTVAQVLETAAGFLRDKG